MQLLRLQKHAAYISDCWLSIERLGSASANALSRFASSSARQEAVRDASDTVSVQSQRQPFAARSTSQSGLWSSFCCIALIGTMSETSSRRERQRRSSTGAEVAAYRPEAGPSVAPGPPLPVHLLRRRAGMQRCRIAQDPAPKHPCREWRATCTAEGHGWPAAQAGTPRKWCEASAAKAERRTGIRPRGARPGRCQRL